MNPKFVLNEEELQTLLTSLDFRAKKLWRFITYSNEARGDTLVQAEEAHDKIRKLYYKLRMFRNELRNQHR